MPINYTPQEEDIIAQNDTPEKVQTFLDKLQYNFEPDGSTLKSFRRTIRTGVAHCMEGMLVTAAILREHGYNPQFVSMEASDIDHMIYVYQKESQWGSVAQSRDPNLKGRPPQYSTLHDLVLSYHPHYYNYFTDDKTDLTLRGYTLVDLNQFGTRWITAEDDVWEIENHLYTVRHKALFPEENKTDFLSNRDGSITWIQADK